MDLSTPTPPSGTHSVPATATPPPAAAAPGPAPPAPDEAGSNDPLDALLKQIIGGWFILTDGQGAVSKWAEPAELLFGKEAPDALGHSFFDGLLSGPLSEEAEQWRRFLAAGDPPHARALVEVTARHAPTNTLFPLEAVFIPVKLDEGFDFSLFLEDLSFELPMNLMLLRMRQQHPVVVRALRAALDAQPQAWDGWRTAGTMVAFRPLEPTPWVEEALARLEEERLRQDAEREEALTNPDPGVHGESVGDLDDAAAVVARLLSALERIDELERIAGRLPGDVEDAKREARAGHARAESAEREAKQARAELQGLSAGVGGVAAPDPAAESERLELLARLERLEGAGHAGSAAQDDDSARAELLARLDRLEHERLEIAAGAEARLAAALAEADARAGAARTELEGRLAELERVGGATADEGRAALETELERLRTERARDAEARAADLQAALERIDREREEADAARGELSAALERVEREHDRELEATRAELAAALERIDAVHRDAERLRERVGEVTIGRHEGEALAGDDRRRLEELQREGEQARARLDALRTLADELREDSVRGAETANSLRAELDALRASEADARAAVDALRTDLTAARKTDGRALAAADGLREELEALRADVSAAGSPAAELESLRADVAAAGRAAAELEALRAELDALRGARAELHELRDHVAGLELSGGNEHVDLQPLVSRIAAIEDEDSSVREQLALMARQLEQIATEPGAAGEIEQLRARLDALAATEQLEALRADVAELRAAGPGRGLDALRHELDQLGGRVADRHDVEDLRRELAALQEPDPALEELRRQLEQVRERTVARADFDELHRSFDALRDGGVGRTDLEAIREQLATLADGWASKGDLDGVRGALAALADRVPGRDELEALRAQFAEARRSVAGRDELDALRSQLDQLREHGAARAELDALRERLDHVRVGLAPAEALEALAVELATLRDRDSALEALQGEVAALREGGAARDEIEALRGELATLRDAGVGHDELEAVRARLEGLAGADQLEALREQVAAAADREELAALSGRIGDAEALRARVDELERLDSDTAALRTTVEGLQAHLDAAREEAAAAREQAETSAAAADAASSAAHEAIERIAEVDRGAGSVLAEVKATGDRLEEVAGLARAAHEAAGASRGDQDELRAGIARLGGELQVAREQLEQAVDEALGARQQAATANEAATAAREDAGRVREDGQLLRRELTTGRERLETTAADVARLGRDVLTVREEATEAAAAAGRAAQERVAAVDATFALMRADVGANSEQVEKLEGGVERLAEQVAAGRAESEARAAELLAELAAVREAAEQANAGVAELRDELVAVRTQAELAGAVAEKARVAAEEARVEDEKVDALQAEVQFAISTMEEMKAGLTSAGQAALVARREAEQAKKAAEHAGDGTGEHVTQVFREILGLAAKGRPRTLAKASDEAPPEPREPRHGFDDEAAPMAMIGLDGKFKELNPSFCRLVGYQEHEFAKAVWPSPHDRQLYVQQQEQFSELISGNLESVPVQSTFMHGQGLMVQVIGEITAVRGEDGLPSHLLLRAEERERAI